MSTRPYRGHVDADPDPFRPKNGVQEVIRDEEVAVIFLKEFWPRIIGDGLAKSTSPLRLRKRTLEIGVSGREWERVLWEMAESLIAKVNGFWNRSLVRRLDFQVVDPWPGDCSGGTLRVL